MDSFCSRGRGVWRWEMSRRIDIGLLSQDHLHGGAWIRRGWLAWASIRNEGIET